MYKRGDWGLNLYNAGNTEGINWQFPQLVKATQSVAVGAGAEAERMHGLYRINKCRLILDFKPL